MRTLLQMLEQDIRNWEKRKNDFDGLELVMIQTHIDKIEMTMKIYRRQREKK